MFANTLVFGGIRTFQIVFDRALEPFFIADFGNFESYFQDQFFPTDGGFSVGNRVQVNTFNGPASPGIDRVSYFADPPVIRSLLDGTPAAPFIDFPLR